MSHYCGECYNKENDTEFQLHYGFNPNKETNLVANISFVM